ncbi:MAG TPA: GNAT family N-acetyltransferase [Bacteroidia bacterium]|nr:GNAT family N-acetyltransferase [Bacteroidia bacterium]
MKIPLLKLESPRLLIRIYTLSDAKPLFQLVDSNKEILADYFPMTVDNNTSVMAKRQYILERNSERNSGKSVFAGIFTPDKKLIGQICAKDINWRVPKCEMGYFLDKDFSGKGLGSEAVLLFSDYCFMKLGIVKITLRIEPKNSASKKLAIKCGFNMIGLSRNDFRSSTGRLMECELWEKISK